MEIRTLGVVGAGQMGSGIAQVAAQAGLRVLLQDIEEAFVRRGLDAIAKNLQRAVDKGKTTAAEKDQVLSRIEGTTRIEELTVCDLVVEAAVENESVKI